MSHERYNVENENHNGKTVIDVPYREVRSRQHQTFGANGRNQGKRNKREKNRAGKYVGTITEGDLLWDLKEKGILNIKQAENLSIMKVERRCDYLPVSIECDMEDLVKRAMEQNFVPVEDDQHFFIGIVTRRDIIGYLSDKIKGCEKND